MFTPKGLKIVLQLMHEGTVALRAQQCANIDLVVFVKQHHVGAGCNLIEFARKRSGKSMADKLANEIQDAYNNQGGAFKRKEDMHRMAEANRAFAHFRF